MAPQTMFRHVQQPNQILYHTNYRYDIHLNFLSFKFFMRLLERLVSQVNRMSLYMNNSLYKLITWSFTINSMITPTSKSTHPTPYNWNSWDSCIKYQGSPCIKHNTRPIFTITKTKHSPIFFPLFTLHLSFHFTNLGIGGSSILQRELVL
jgi:hypothetical protein